MPYLVYYNASCAWSRGLCDFLQPRSGLYSRGYTYETFVVWGNIGNSRIYIFWPYRDSHEIEHNANERIYLFHKGICTTTFAVKNTRCQWVNTRHYRINESHLLTHFDPWPSFQRPLYRFLKVFCYLQISIISQKKESFGKFFPLFVQQRMGGIIKIFISVLPSATPAAYRKQIETAKNSQITKK